MARVYTNIIDEVTKRTFDVVIPESYRFHPVRRAEGDNNPPIYQPPDPNERARSKLTLRHIVDMCFQKVEFTIVNPNDTATMVEILTNYLKHIAMVHMIDEETKIFNERVQLTIDVLSQHVARRANWLKKTNAPVFKPNRLQEIFDSLRTVQAQALQSITQQPPVPPQ